MADGTLAGEIDDVQRPNGVAQFARPDVKAMVPAQQLAECGEILREAREGVHQRFCADTEPNPKSVSRLYPPDSRLAGTSPRMGSTVA